MPVLYHHDTNWVGDHGRAAAILNLADLMAHGLGGDSDQQEDHLAEASHAMELLELTSDNLKELAVLVKVDLKRLGSVLSFQN